MCTEAAHRLIGSWGWKRSQKPLVQTPLPSAPVGRPLQVSSLSPSAHAHLHLKELSTTCHRAPLRVKTLCEMETSGHCSRVGSLAEG